MAGIAHPPPRGEFIDIGGRKLRIVREGPGGTEPLVVLEAGAFGLASDWAEVQARLQAQGVQSCAYDRAGMGYSDPGPEPRDGIAVTKDLEQLLAAIGEPGPYLLVGHSMAGLPLRLFTGRNPGKVSGLVLVDAATPEQADTAAERSMIGQFTAVSHLAAFGASIGLMEPLGFLGDTIGLPKAAAAEKRWAFANRLHNHTSAQEVDQWMRTAAQAKATGPLNPQLPVAVVTAGHPPPATEAQQAAPARLSAHGYYANVAAANHATLLGARFAGEIVKAIDFVRAAAAETAAASG